MAPRTTEPSPHPLPETAHVVKFYEHEDDLYALVGAFFADGAATNDPLLVIARGSRHERFVEAVRAHGRGSEHLLLIDAEEALQAFMSGVLPDEERFVALMDELLTPLAGGRLRAYGEMVDVLWENGNPEAAVRLEELWNRLAARHDFSLVCAYPIHRFDQESDRGLFDAVCARHTHVVPVHGKSIGDEARLVAALQQRTRSLEIEIGKRKQLEDELRRLYELAQESNRTKDQFLATLSHELRTPLTAILGWAHMLSLGGLDPETTRIGAQTIEQSARAQAAIVDDLLDLSCVVTGKITLRRELVDLAAAVSDAVQTCRLAAEAKQIAFSITAPPGRAIVMGDPTRLRQIVWNLMSNAIKYSDPGGRVEVSVERAGAAARIVVRDNGRGIAPPFLRHVFDPFRQADGSSTRRYGGLGLGLAIVKHLTELHGGTVEAASDGRGRGATFTITLPVVQAEGATVRDHRAEAGVDLSGKRILIVDDDAPTTDLLGAILRRFGARVDVAPSIFAALDSIREAPPHAVVTDVGFDSGDDGYVLLTNIRDLSLEQPLPVIAVSALSEPATEQRIQLAGFHAYIRKPLEPLLFARCIADMVEPEADAVN
jgi:signal transduction histidine kinase